MTDWLNSDDSGDGSYLGLDDPAMPDSAPAPPSAPSAVATAPPADGGWLGGNEHSSDGGDDWLGGASSTAGPASDSSSDWLAADAAVTPGAPSDAAYDYEYEAPRTPPQAAPPATGYAPQAPAAAPAQPHEAISIASPQLPQVQPTPRGHGSGAAAISELNGLVLDVEVQVEVGLGHAALTVEEFLEMGRGSVIELDTPIDAAIELKVRGKLIARGQLVSVNGSYGMRIIEMLNEEH